MSPLLPTRKRAAGALAVLTLAFSCADAGSGEGPRTSVQFLTSKSTVAEGAASTGVLVELSTADAALGDDLVIAVADLGAGTAASGLDFAPIPEQTLVFPAGSADGALLAVQVQTLADPRVEGAPETIRLRLSSPSGAALGPRTTHTVAIADEDTASISFETSASATPDEAQTEIPIAIVLTLPPGTTLDAALSVRMADAKTGSATRGGDYAAFAPKTVALPPGSLSGTIFPAHVPILDDSEQEGAETIVLALSAPSEGLVPGANGTHTLTITDDDLGPGAELRVIGIPGGGELFSGASVSLGSQILQGGSTGGTVLRIESSGIGPLAFELPWITGGAERDFALEFVPDWFESASGDGIATLPSPLVSPPSSAAGGAIALDPGLLAASEGHAQVRWTDFPLADERLELDLVRREAPWTADARVVIDGIVTAPRDWLGDAALWSGTVRGESGSSVFLALSSAGSHGWIRRASGTIHLVGSSRAPLEVLEVSEPEIAALGGVPPAEFCREPPRPTGFDAPRGTQPALEVVGSGPLPLCRVAIETDFQLFNRFDDPGLLVTYVNALVAAASERFQTDVGVELSMSYLGVHTTPDDGWSTPDVLGTPGQMLDEFQHRWGAAWGGAWPAPANLAHFLSGASLGGGVAYIGALCDQNWGFAVSANINGTIPWSSWTGAAGPLNWDFVVFTHELGHNFGSQHTHAYCPPIDRCYTSCSVGLQCQQGTLMSYCHLCGGIGAIDLRFHPFTANEMRSQVRTSCLGEALLLPGDTLDVRVRFDPVTALGPRSTNIVFEHNAGNAPVPFEIVLSGTAIP